MRSPANLLFVLLSTAGCSGPTRDAIILDPADYPVEFEGSFLEGAAGAANVDIAEDGTAVFELRAYRRENNDAGILGPASDSLAHGVLALDPAESADDQLRFIVHQEAEAWAYPTLATYHPDVHYQPVTGTVSISPAGAIEAHLMAPRDGVPTADYGYTAWVEPPEALDEVARGPASVHCAEGFTHASCGAAP